MGRRNAAAIPFRVIVRPGSRAVREPAGAMHIAEGVAAEAGVTAAIKIAAIAEASAAPQTTTVETTTAAEAKGVSRAGNKAERSRKKNGSEERAWVHGDHHLAAV